MIEREGDSLEIRKDSKRCSSIERNIVFLQPCLAGRVGLRESSVKGEREGRGEKERERKGEAVGQVRPVEQVSWVE